MKKSLRAKLDQLVSEDLHKVVEDIEKILKSFQHSVEIGIQKHNGKASIVTLKILFKL